MSASADRTIVTWHFEKPVSSIGRGSRGKGEEEEEKEGESSQMTSEVNIKDYRYKSRKFFSMFPIHHLIDDDPDHSSFMYE